MLDPIVARRTRLLADAALLLLALLTVGIAHVHLGGWNSLIALVIAATQALVIALFFMELKFASPLVRIVALAALLWMGIMVVGTLDDLLTRGWLPIPGK